MKLNSQTVQYQMMKLKTELKKKKLKLVMPIKKSWTFKNFITYFFQDQFFNYIIKRKIDNYIIESN